MKAFVNRPSLWQASTAIFRSFVDLLHYSAYLRKFFSWRRTITIKLYKLFLTLSNAVLAGASTWFTPRLSTQGLSCRSHARFPPPLFGMAFRNTHAFLRNKLLILQFSCRSFSRITGFWLFGRCLDIGKFPFLHLKHCFSLISTSFLSALFYSPLSTVHTWGFCHYREMEVENRTHNDKHQELLVFYRSQRIILCRLPIKLFSLHFLNLPEVSRL